MTLGKIGQHVGEPLRAHFQKSHLKLWKALRNLVHNQVVKSAYDDQLKFRETDSFVLVIIKQHRASRSRVNADGQIQSAGGIVERKEIAIAQQFLALRATEKNSARAVFFGKFRFFKDFI